MYRRRSRYRYGDRTRLGVPGLFRYGYFRSEDWFICEGKYMRKIISLYVVALSLFAHGQSGPAPDKRIWYSCSKDSDCVSAEGACGPESINKKYKTPFEKHAKEIMPYVDCMPIDRRVRKSICYKKICKFK